MGLLVVLMLQQTIQHSLHLKEEKYLKGSWY
jgi:hypothetical protein